MNAIVRRVEQTPALTGPVDNWLPAKIYHQGPIYVNALVAHGIEPKIHLSWSVVPRYWGKGFSLLLFRSLTGFCPERYPDDLNLHGQLVAESTRDAYLEERPVEGTNYYTFVLHKRGFLGLSEKVAVLRFSETVPSAKVAISRIKDQIEFKELIRRHELGNVRHKAELIEAKLRLLESRRKRDQVRRPKQRATLSTAERVVADELADVDAMVEALLARRQKIEELRSDPRWKKLRPAERKAVIERIRASLDPGEVSAWREMRGKH